MLENLKELTKFSKDLKILYVEDNQEAREQTLKMLKNLFNNVVIGVDGLDGLQKFKENSSDLDLVITDINMPNMNGIEMLENIRKIDDHIPCIIISAHNETNFFLNTISLGVDGYVLKPVNLQLFINTISKVLEKVKLKKENIKFKQDLVNINTDLEAQVIARIGEIYALNQEIEDTQREVIYTLASVGESRCKETGNHVKRVALYSEILALKYGIGEKEADMIKMASPMHDIGKVGIPDSVLKKDGKHTQEEFELMKTHARLGYDMLKSSKRQILQAAAIIAHQHHEKYDGSGYPQGLKGEDIHIYGRITALADVFDALGSSRVYKKAWEDEKIFELFEEQKGKHFDPKLVELFFENIDEFLAVRDRLQD
jgi:putative two-component system response regulator